AAKSPAPAGDRATRDFFLRLLAAAERGPGRAERGSPCRRSSAYIRHTHSPSFRRKPESIVLLLLGPSEKRRRADGKAASPHAGGARDRADLAERPWMAS